MNNKYFYKMKSTRVILVRIVILLIILLTTSCAVTSKYKYRKRRKIKPCDCPQYGKSSAEIDYTATAHFWDKTD